MTVPDIVICCQCGATYEENDPRVTYIFGEWCCMWEDECTDRRLEADRGL